MLWLSRSLRRPIACLLLVYCRHSRKKCFDNWFLCTHLMRQHLKCSFFIRFSWILNFYKQNELVLAVKPSNLQENEKYLPLYDENESNRRQSEWKRCEWIGGTDSACWRFLRNSSDVDHKREKKHEKQTNSFMRFREPRDDIKNECVHNGSEHGVWQSMRWRNNHSAILTTCRNSRFDSPEWVNAVILLFKSAQMAMWIWKRQVRNTF